MGTTENTEDTEKNNQTSRLRAARQRPALVYETLTARVRQTAYEVHTYFGKGFLEKVYENALAHRLEKQGVAATKQASLSVYDEDGTVVGEYVADIIVDNAVLVEIKAVSELTSEHKAQTLNYLKATGLRIGMLLNFGQSRLQVKRLAL